MKRKINKILGVGLTLVLLTSMLIMAAPASAGTLSWGVKSGADIPSTTNEILADGSSLIDMAVSADGEIIYVVADISGADKLFKSTNGGDTWSEVTLPSALATILRFVAIAPDNSDIVVIASATSVVYASTNGGSGFSTLSTPTGSGGAIEAISDLAVSPLSGTERYIAVAGKDTATNDASLCYFNLGASAPIWKDALNSTDFTGGQPTATADIDNVDAVAFSPNFASDQVITAVISEITTGGTVGYVRFHTASFNQLSWDTTEFGTPIVLETSANITAVPYADISLDPEYLGGDDATRISFVGLSVTADSAEVGGVYRLKDTALRQEKTGYGISSVAWDGTNIAAGASITNNVYRSADALASSPTYSDSRGNKEIGISSGDDAVIVRWSGDTLLGVKSGDASSFARSTDNGKVWNEIALMDTALTTMLDFAVSADGSTQYLLTADGSGEETSLFRKDSSWHRIFVSTTVADDWIVRIALDDPDTIYIADVGAALIYYTNDGGLEKWTQRTSRYNIADLAVQSTDIAYVANNANDEVSKTTNGGFTWGADVDSTSSGGDCFSLTLIAEDQLLLGTTTGYVAYSSDGNASWGKVSTALSVSGNAQVTADGLADGDYIYAATSGNTTLVQRWQIGVSTTSWTDMAAPTSGNYGCHGLILNNGALYALTADDVADDSALLRTLSPTTSTPAASYWVTVASAAEDFSLTPSSLKLSAGSTNLWAIDTVANGLWSFTDTLATGLDIELVSPVEGFQNPVNPVSGTSQDISFKWNRPTSGTAAVAYEVRIKASDAATTLATGTRAATDSAAPNLLMGPNQSSPAAIQFAPGQTYYWQVRATTPVDSPWSALRSFTIETLQAAVPEILSPSNGTLGASRTPSFSWAPVSGATEYRFKLADNVALANSIVDVKVKSTGYALATKELDRGKTYYWAVMPIAPVQGAWSAIANFTVAEEVVVTPSAPPVVIQQVPPPVINIPAAPPQPADIIIPPAPPAPAPITPAYIWAIIIIGAVLVIAVIVLIVRTRRTV